MYFYVRYQTQFVLMYLREDFHIPSPLFVAPTLSGGGGGGGYDLNKREPALPPLKTILHACVSNELCVDL